MRYSVRNFILLAVVTLIIFAFQNCGRVGFDGQKGSKTLLASYSVCEGLIRQTYSQTYFPLLSSPMNCNQCHSDAHGSTDFETSYSAFMRYGPAEIDSRASNSHGDNGLNLATEIAEIKPQWEQGLADYEDCLASNMEGSESLDQ